MEGLMGTGQGRRLWTLLGIGLSVATITALHYLTTTESVVSHNVFRRLYYLPIVWAALTWGLRGGLVVAGLVSVAYFPHAFIMAGHMDPAPPTDKILEMVLFFGVGGLAGLLVDRERRARRREERAALARLAAEHRAERLAGLVHLTRGLAHEIRNPLGGIQGALEILADGPPDADHRREMLEVALKETGRLGRVLDDFLSFARPREPDPAPFDPTGPLAHVADLFGPQAAEHRVSLKREAHATGRAFADAEQITQVLINLVRNALQFTPAGGRITLSTSDLRSSRGTPSRVRFAVTDTGAGVDRELGQSIYDPYVTSRDDGSGLGLSISAMLAGQNGGTLTHQANPGGGTTFSFDLPTQEGAPA